VGFLARAKDLADHPMMLPVIVGELVSTLFARKIDSSDRRLNGIEETTGMHTFDWRPKGNPFAMDMLQTTRSLNSCSATLGVLEMRINGLIQMFESILRYNDYICEAVPPDRKESLRQGQHVLKDSIDNMINLCKSLLLRVVYNQKRATTQLAVVSSPSLKLDPPGLLYYQYRSITSCSRKITLRISRLQPILGA